MSTASPDRATRAGDSDVALVEQLYREVTALSRAARMPASDRRKSRQLEELAEATPSLAQAPALRFAEVVTKLTILCSRLHEELHPDVGGELIDCLLAEAILNDCRILAADECRRLEAAR